MPTVVDLFAGAGGLSLGASRAGFNVGAAVEIDPHAMATHTLNFPNTVHIQDDITKLTGPDILARANLRPEDLIGIIGGPPCQGFSSIGHGNVDDIRNALFVKFFEIVADLQPAFFVAENVPGIMKEKYQEIRSEAFRHIQNYTLLPPIAINASEYGAPTTRTRYFFIGYRDCERIVPFGKDDIEKKKIGVAYLPILSRDYKCANVVKFLAKLHKYANITVTDQGVMQKYVFFLNDYLKTKKSSVLTHNHLYNLLHEVLEVSLGTPSQIAAEEGAKTPADSRSAAIPLRTATPRSPIVRPAATPST